MGWEKGSVNLTLEFSCYKFLRIWGLLIGDDEAKGTFDPFASSSPINNPQIVGILQEEKPNIKEKVVWLCETNQTTSHTKIGSAGLILATKTSLPLLQPFPHGGPILAKLYLPKLVFHKMAQLFMAWI